MNNRYEIVVYWNAEDECFLAEVPELHASHPVRSGYGNAAMVDRDRASPKLDQGVGKYANGGTRLIDIRYGIGTRLQKIAWENV